MELPGNLLKLPGWNVSLQEQVEQGEEQQGSGCIENDGHSGGVLRGPHRFCLYHQIDVHRYSQYTKQDGA